MLRVLPTGAKSWIWRGTVRGRRVDRAVGKYPYMSLGEARARAFEFRRMSLQGDDPQSLRSGADIPTLADAIREVIALHEPTWKNPRQAEHWRASFRDHLPPRIGRIRVDSITTRDVMTVLRPIWTAKPAAAQKLRQRFGAVMKWCIAQGFRQDNPAAEAISAALPKVNGKKHHHDALPHAEVPEALSRVREADAWAGLKLTFEFLILTACRSSEVRRATWDEVDLERGVWTISPDRMKSARQHRVPLSDRAVAVLTAARELDNGSGLIFPSKRGVAIRGAVLSRLLVKAKIAGTVHGLRSSFRDWCAETGVDRVAAELALAHNVGSDTEQAYMRSDLFDKRRELMQAWGDYLG